MSSPIDKVYDYFNAYFEEKKKEGGKTALSEPEVKSEEELYAALAEEQHKEDQLIDDFYRSLTKKKRKKTLKAFARSVYREVEYYQTNPCAVKVGQIPIPEGRVDITDPCYDAKTWCRINRFPIIPGVYDCYIDHYKDDPESIKSCTIRHSQIIDDDLESIKIGHIGVDTGQAGFFVDKPDFDKDTWNQLCDELLGKTPNNLIKTIVGHDAYITDFSGKSCFWTTSGFGDGEYDVFAYYGATSEQPEEPGIVGLTIIF